MTGRRAGGWPPEGEIEEYPHLPAFNAVIWLQNKAFFQLIDSVRSCIIAAAPDRVSQSHDGCAFLPAVVRVQVVCYDKDEKVVVARQRW